MRRSFRIVADPKYLKAVENLLMAEGFDMEPEPFSPFCRRLAVEPAPLGSSLAAYLGYIYIQDRSSMLPPIALAPEEGAAILDMAASPGSKTGFLAQLAGPNGLVLGNEPNSGRLATLRANLQRCNLPQAAACGYAGEKLPLRPHSWPYILLDPPCSGWGTVDKNPKAMKIWQGEKIGRLENIQRGLLSKAAPLLAPGGKLLYSTCTTNKAENQCQTKFAIEELGLAPLPLAPFPGFVFEETEFGGLLVNGEASEAQGFYLSLLQKKGPCEEITAPEISSLPGGGEIAPKPSLAGPVFDPDLLPEGDVAIFGGNARFLPALWRRYLTENLRWQGFLLGKWQGGRLAPWPRLRICLPKPDAANAIIFEEIEPIKRLIAGASLNTGIKGASAALWWRDLPLGACLLKSGRVALSWK